MVRTSLATAAAVSESAVGVAVQPASVRVTVTITTVSAAQTSAISSGLTALLPSAAVATGVIGVTVEATPSVTDGSSTVSWAVTTTNATLAAAVHASLSALTPAQMSSALGVPVAVNSVGLTEAVVLPAPSPPPASGDDDGGGGGEGFTLLGLEGPLGYALIGGAVFVGLLLLVVTCVCLRKPKRRNLHDEAVDRLSHRQAKHRNAAGKKPAPGHSPGSPQAGRGGGRNQMVQKDVLMSDGI
jgi:hypothetical protein